jgi:predicted ferric reductase
MDQKPVAIVFRWQQVLGWTIVAVACLIPVLRYLMLAPFSENFGSFYTFMSSLGRLTGLVGMVLFAIDFILATRLRMFEKWFGGLNRVYIAHHILGGLALVLMAFHPVFLALRYLTTSIHEAALLLLPHLHEMNHYYWALDFGIIGLDGTIVLLVITFFIKLPYNIWLWTHKFLGIFFFVTGLHVLFLYTGAPTDWFMKVYILGFTLLGLAAFVYRTLIGRILIRTYEYKVDDVTVVGGTIAQVALIPLGERMPYQPGQFMFIRFKLDGQKNITSEWHPFSISSAPGDDFLRIDAKALGDYTRALMGLQKGAVAEIEGAYGKFSYTNYSNPRQIWVAGGIGITPFLGMARNLRQDPNLKNMQIDMYYMVRNKSELVDYGALHEIAYFNKANFRLFPHVSSEQGQLNMAIINEKSGGVAGKEIFICGPPPMMKSFKQQFHAQGVPKALIHSEEFSMS